MRSYYQTMEWHETHDQDLVQLSATEGKGGITTAGEGRREEGLSEKEIRC